MEDEIIEIDIPMPRKLWNVLAAVSDLTGETIEEVASRFTTDVINAKRPKMLVAGTNGTTGFVYADQ